ncbi:enhanced entry protein EnhC [Legionella donaldsonii]|uniref:Enhanced entry protein EnhC n=1 Tax=Legionella donaldsonii TaxID=45060 RepID=A0A378J1H3_9GAMM|nr:tetratricopeptide repeat protein [Legionella donaldsonii]STX41128.1 enhanced entry protein EnhC [Legionella donaldsonii]
MNIKKRIIPVILSVLAIIVFIVGIFAGGFYLVILALFLFFIAYLEEKTSLVIVRTASITILSLAVLLSIFLIYLFFKNSVNTEENYVTKNPDYSLEEIIELDKNSDPFGRFDRNSHVIDYSNPTNSSSRKAQEQEKLIVKTSIEVMSKINIPTRSNVESTPVILRDRCFVYYLSQQYKDSLMYCQSSSEAGNPYATYILGIQYYNGLGVKKDKEIGLSNFIKSAGQGYPYAQFTLAIIYLEMGKNELANKWNLKAKEQLKY